MPERASSLSPFALLPLIGIPVFLAIANQTMISVAIPQIGADLGQLRRLPWLVTGYMIATTISGPVYGLLGDTYGRARMLMAALAGYILGSLMCSLAPNLEFLVLGRVLQGLAGGGLMSLSQAMIGDLVAPRQQGRAQGFIAMLSVLASTLGPLIGGLLVETLGWRSLFISTVPLALLSMILLGRYKSAAITPSTRKFDLGGFLSLLLLVFGATLMVESFSENASLFWPLVGGAACLAGIAMMIRTQTRAANPMFPPRLFANPAISRAMAMVTFHGAALVSMVTLIPLFHAILRVDGALDTAFSMLALTAAFGISGVIVGNLITVTGRTALFPSLTLLLATAGLVHLAIFGPDLGRAALMGNYLWIGLSIGSTMPMINTTVQRASPNDLRGRAAGATSFFRSIGAVLGTALTSAILFHFAPHGAHADPGALLLGQASIGPTEIAVWKSAFRIAFFTIAAFTVGGWAMAMANPLRRLD